MEKEDQNPQEQQPRIRPIEHKVSCLWYSTLLFMIIAGLGYGGAKLTGLNLNLELEKQNSNFCTTEPVVINGPTGPIVIGREGKQDMRDPIKAKIVRTLQTTGITEVHCP